MDGQTGAHEQMNVVKMDPTVSVIIPTFNRANLVGHAIRSVLAQTEQDWECLVIDDGSTDDTRQVVTAFQDIRIRYIYQENQKAAAARNTGLRHSHGRYVAFLDSDDRFLPDKLRLQLRRLENDQTLGMVVSGWNEVDLEGHELKSLSPWLSHPVLDSQLFLYQCPIIVPAVMIQKSWLERVQGFDSAFPAVEDWDLWLRLSFAGCPMAWEPGQVCSRTLHTASQVRNYHAMETGTRMLFDKVFALPGLPEQVKNQQTRILANMHLDCAVRAISAGATGEGENHLKQAITIDPLLLTGDPPQILDSLAGAALTHMVPDRAVFIQTLSSILPNVSPRLPSERRKLTALLSAVEAFDSRRNGRPWDARCQAARAAWLDPGWIRNRGLLRIIVG